ncbi:beta strand repeat-containing protein [Nostoc sp. CMAA1605]|uniref:beta strand repeat-containing protein n=1 Tax=Nostoc sp. CMAA1605 TaxID=2055159 RepID=UPI001F1D33BC|nr:hypothetical protein [Nostoc sp. CMAA1605]MCF4969229.1 hypothetical protein [Nostoc sp. CMAA1605]
MEVTNISLFTSSGDPLNPFPDAVTFAGSNHGDHLFLRVNANNLLAYSTDGANFTAVENFTFSSATRITVDLRGGNDSLDVDVSLVDALTGVSGSLMFVGGEGNDTLFGSSADTTWNITGNDSGKMSTVVEYSGVENLTGADNNQDTFVVSSGGRLSGLMHGGNAGYDTLVFESNYQSGVFTGTGPNSGSIQVDGATFTYDGLEPIIVAGVAELAVNVTGSNNTIRIKDNGDPNDGQFIVESPGIETHILTNPATSFTLNAGGAGDTVIVESLDPGFNAAFKIANAGTINVQSNVNVTSGNITFDAINTINVADNVTLETTTGDLRLQVDSGFDLTWESVTPFFKDRNSAASINVGQATLKGKNVDILTSATTSKFAGFEVDEAGLAGLVSGQVVAALTGNPKLEFAFSETTGSTIKRLNGSWIADGFQVGQTIVIQDSPQGLNDGEYQIKAVTNDTITLADTDTLTAQIYDPTVTLVPILVEEVITEVPLQDIPLVAVDSAGNQISTTSFTAAGLQNSFLETLATTKIFDFIGLGFQVFLSKATSEITIGSGAIINASNNVSINSGAVSDIFMATSSLIAGLTYGTSDAIARSIVKTGANITAGNRFNLDAFVTNNMNLTTSVVSGLLKPPSKKGGKFIKFPGPSAVVTYGKGYSESLALLEEGTIVTAGNAQVNASSNNNFIVTSTDKVLFPSASPLGATAIGVAVSETESYSNAIVKGKVTTTQGDLAVDAKSINITHDTFTKVSVKNKGPAIPGLDSKINGATQALGIRSPGAFGLSAGVSWSQGINQANAQIGSTADLTIAKDLKVTSRAEDNFKSVAIGGGKSATLVSLGGAVAYADYSNVANAFIDKNAQVNATGAVTVSADAIVPNQIDVDNDLQAFANFRPTIPSFSSNPISATQQIINTGLTALAIILPYRKAVPNKIATTFAEATAQAGDKDFGNPGLLAVSATGNILKAANLANAYIGQEAQVTGKQGVNIAANAWSETVNTAGLASNGIPLPGGVSSQGSAVGGTYNDITLINTAKAFIDDGAVVDGEAGDIVVKANTRSFILNIVEAGGKATDIGVAGAVAINDFQNTALAYIEDKARVTTNQNVVVNADNDMLGINVGVTLIRGAEVAAAGSVGINQVNNVTKAYIGNSTGDDDTGITGTGLVTAGKDVSVEAFSRERLISVALTAALSEPKEPAPPPKTPKDSDIVLGTTASLTDKIPGGSKLPGATKTQGAGFLTNGASFLNTISNKTGLGIAGNVSINDVNATTYAFISDDVTVNAGGDLTIQAINDAPLMLAIATAAAAELSKGDGGGALAGSFTLNDLDRDVRAFTNKASITARNVDVLASNRDFYLSITAGVGATAPKGTAAVAGSVNLNFIDTTLVAALGDNTTLTATGDVSVEAKDILPVTAVAGAISGALPGTKVGVGAAVDVSIINRNVSAYIGKNAAVTLTGNLDVQALTLEEIVSVAASLVAGSESLGLVGQATSQNLTTNVFAYIDRGAVVSADQNILVEAQDITNIGDRNRPVGTTPPNVTVIAGGATVGQGNGFGGSIGNINIIRNVKAYIADETRVDAYALGNNPIFTGDYEVGRTFNPKGDPNISVPAAVDEANNTIDLGAGHGLVTGDAVIYDNGGGGNIGGLEDRRIYYVIVDSSNANKVKLTKTRVDALAGTNEIDLTIVPYVPLTFNFGTIGVTHRLDRASKRVDVDGLAVKANVVDTINLASATSAISLGEGSTGIGSVAVHTNDTTVAAYIGDGATNAATGAKINQGSKAADTDQSVTVTANYDASILGVAGGISGTSGGSAAIGASVDTQILTAKVDAHIGAFAVVDAENDITIQANTQQSVQSYTVTAAVNLNLAAVSAQGSVSVLVLNNTTTAFIANDAQVTAGQDITVAADDNLFLRVVDAGIAGGGNTGVSGSFGVVSEINNVNAYIGDRAQASAQGNIVVSANSDADIEMGVGSGALSLGEGLGASIAVLVRSDTVTANIGNFAKVTALGLGSSFIAPAGYNGATQSMRGLSVTATSTEDILVIAVAGASAGITAIAGSVPVVILNETTTAFIGDNATINANNGNADARQSINVLAVDQTKLLVVAGALGGGGVNGIGAGVEQRTITKTTEAYIGASLVNAKGNIQVSARSQEDLLAVAAAAVGGGSIGLAGAVGVQVLNVTTKAFVSPGGAVINADGTIVISAEEHTDLDTIAGSLSAGGAASVGASVIVPVINKNTQAFIGAGAIVAAKGLTSGITVNTGNFNTSTTLPATSVNPNDPATNAALPKITTTEFNPASAINGSADTITLNASSLVTGQAVIYSNGGGSSIGVAGADKLVNGQTYYVIKLNNNAIKLASSKANANAGIAIDLDPSTATGTAHSITPFPIALPLPPPNRIIVVWQ